MVDVDCAVGYTPCLTAADSSGYEIDEAEVIYWGRCPECAAAATSVSPHG
jgi:Fur family ferric uptake transcriptional regulator